MRLRTRRACSAATPAPSSTGPAKLSSSSMSLRSDGSAGCGAPGPAPLRDARGDAIEAFRQRAQRLTCIAGLSGLPQVNLPAASVDGAPVGLSLIGPPGRDLDLLALAVELEQ